MSHSSGSSSSPVPPIRRLNPGESTVAFASVFQWPGGVSDRGPSAQNAARARA